MKKLDAIAEKSKLIGMSRKELETLERTTRSRATPTMKQRHMLVVAEIHSRDLNELQNFHK